MSQTDRQLINVLEQLGFEQTPRGAEAVWTSSSSTQSPCFKAKLELLQRKDRFTLDKFNLNLDIPRYAILLETNIRKKFQKLASCSIRFDVNHSIRSIIEISPQSNRRDENPAKQHEEPGTIIGWTTRITCSRDSIILQVTDAFFIGYPVKDWWFTIMRTVAESLTPNLSGFWQTHNLFEISLPIYLLGAKADNINLNVEDLFQNLASLKIKNPRPLMSENKGSKLVVSLATTNKLIDVDYPLEILEARETTDTWQQIDRAIINKEAVPSFSDFFPQYPGSFFARIAALPSISEKHPALTATLPTELTDLSLTTLTGLSLIQDKLGHTHELIKTVSQLLRSISIIYGDLNNHAPFVHILPEILGDIWSRVDPQRAFASWGTSLNSNSKNLRVLHKMSKLAFETDNTTQEIRALLDIAQWERRAPLLKESALRLIDIFEKSPDNHKLNLENLRSILENAAEKTDFDDKIVMTLSKILCSQGKHRKAFSFLELCIQSNKDKISPTQLANLHAEIGFIWQNFEKNSNLAAARFITATSPPCQPSDKLLDQVEDFFASEGNMPQISRLLELRVSRKFGVGTTEALERTAKYMNRMGQHKESLSAVLALMEMNRYQQWYCDVILDAAEDTSIPWEKVSKLMFDARPDQLPKDILPIWKLITGRCAIKSTMSNHIAIQSLTDKSVIPLLLEADTDFVIKNLAEEQNSEQLRRFISRRLPIAKEIELRLIINTVVELNLIDTDGMFDHAVAQASRDADDFTLSLQRIEQLINSQDTQSLLTCVKAHVEVIANKQRLVTFLDSTISLVMATANAGFEDILSELVTIRNEQTAFSNVEAELLIENLLKNNFIKVAQDLLKAAIRSGSFGAYDEEVIHNILSSQEDLIAQWHYIAYKNENNPKKAQRHATKCLEYWLLTESRPVELIDVITFLGTSNIISTETLSLLELLCTREGLLSVFIDSVANQMELNPQNIADLMYWGIRITNARHLNPEIPPVLFQKTFDKLNESQLHKNFSQAMLWLNAGNQSEAQMLFTKILKEPEVLAEPEICNSALEGLVKTKPHSTHLAAIIQSLISWAQNINLVNLEHQLIQKSIDLEIANHEHLHQTFITKFSTGSASTLASITTQALRKVERSTGGVKKLLEDWAKLDVVMKDPEKWKDILANLTNEHLLRQLRSPARCEILFLHASNLLDSENRRFDAIPHLELILLENPLDSRVWIPLYSLYEECDAKQKIITHLDRIIPLLEKDGSILERTPFNIESLKNTLSRARKFVIDSGHISRVSPLPINNNVKGLELNQHAARLQQNWVNAIPSVKISAINLDPNNSDNPNYQPILEPTSELVSSEKFQIAEGSAAYKLEHLQAEQPPLDAKLESDASEVKKADLTIVTSTRSTSSKTLLDWRELVLSGHAPKGTTKKVMTMAFASELEKHLAVQSVALISAETVELEHWHWPVWRNPDAFQYQTNLAGRLPKESNFRQYGSLLHKLLKFIAPVILRSNKSKFLAENIIQNLGRTNSESSTEIQLNHQTLSGASLEIFSDLIRSSKLRFFDAPALYHTLFFDPSKRSFYFDTAKILHSPQTILSYKIIENLIYFRKGIPGIPFLDAETEIVPVIQKIRDILGSTGLDRLRIAFGIDHAEINSQLKSIDRDQLVSLISAVSDKTTSDLENLQQEIRLKTYSDIFAKTLDIIGISESLLEVDLCKPDSLEPGSIRSLHPIIDYLMTLATNLKV